MRMVARAYAILVVVLLAYAWYVDIRLQDSEREHLLADMLLTLASLPSSLSLDFFYRNWTSTATRPFAQLIWISGCASAQVVALFAVDRALRCSWFRTRRVLRQP